MMHFLFTVWRWLQMRWWGGKPQNMDVDAVSSAPLAPPMNAGSEWRLRVPQALLDQMRTDLRRPHDFASERVGILLAREAEGHGDKLLLAWRYEPVHEHEYIDDRCVGARINREVIRRMLSYALSGESVLHVHLHEHSGRPGFSFVDEKNLQELIPSFRAVAPQCIHGALLLSADHGIAWGWMAGREGAIPASSITVVGQPLQYWEVSS
jgi:hypothetical protein